MVQRSGQWSFWGTLVAALLVRQGLAQADEPFDIVFSVGGLDGQPAESSFTMRVEPEWAPLGAARVRELVEEHFFDECRFFRVIDGFMAQFGLNGDPAVTKIWREKKIADDPRRNDVSNTRGLVSFASAGPGTRTSQLFINFGDNHNLDSMGFTPLGRITSGMDVVDRIYKVGEGKPQGPGPSQGDIQLKGNSYLLEEFPKISFIRSARISEQSNEPAAALIGKAGGVEVVECKTTEGTILIEVHPEWSPLGAARFLDLVRDKYLDGSAFFRAVENWLVQFGLSPNAELRAKWQATPPLKDDPLRPDIPIKRGTMAFAGSGPDSRTTQIWMAFEPSDTLGTMPWETPFAQVIGDSSLSALGHINTEYGEQVNQASIWNEGYDYLQRDFPRLSYIKTCQVQASSTDHPKVAFLRRGEKNQAAHPKSATFNGANGEF
mmetsp:Transcript_54370/g.117687  ORF Transcript_54370/g.117687 Transcript_54370/m.117687 type:complete len:435 (-) Transcript_54370:129-1433(-)